eukprot:GFUD01114033.1.p1 GENE.GFUD01114033.1~~GFUD01114033.1.p1  ORF type:complete len:198 (-),score=16.69 GFUD01114033.1:118-651(-)
MMCLILLAMTAYFPSLAVSGCDGALCYESNVTAGNYSYIQVQYKVNYPLYGCCWNCTYEMVGYPGSRYCFKEGPTKTVPGIKYGNCFEEDKVYQGVSLGQELYTTNAFECGRACNATTGCNYWTFSNEIGMGGPMITNIKPGYVFYQLPQFWTACYLFISGTTYDRKDAISGVKGCP